MFHTSSGEKFLLNFKTDVNWKRHAVIMNCLLQSTDKISQLPDSNGSKLNEIPV